MSKLDPTRYPEHHKVELADAEMKASRVTNYLSAFLDYISDELNIDLVEFNDGGHRRAGKVYTKASIISGFLEVDQKSFDKEKELMIEDMCAATQRASG